MRKIRKFLYYIILLVLLITFFILLINIFSWFNDNHNTKKITQKIKENTDLKNIENNNDGKFDLLLDVDLAKLRKINEDTVAYIKVSGTNIEYPVVQTDNNDFYLTHSFDKSYNKAGWVFLDYRNNIKYLDDNTILYAHGRLDNTMFGSLRNVIKESWYTNNDNHYIQYSTDYYSTKWEVFSTYKIRETTDYLYINFDSDSKSQDFINTIIKRSIYDYKKDVTSKDKIITLSSCYDDYYRVVLHAKLVDFVKKK